MKHYSEGSGIRPGIAHAPKSCVVMFSGGRDSTLAAARLYHKNYDLLLVTVTSEHLTGMASVRRRLTELRLKLAMQATWLHIIQPASFASRTPTQHKTCLPCHAAYTAIGSRVALDSGASSVAFGYTGYQSDWVEQTPQAIQILRGHLAGRGIELLLPVLDLPSRDQAIGELKMNGLSQDALEQKCLVQQFNRPLAPHEERMELQRWKQALEQMHELAEQERPVVVERGNLDSMEPFHD